MHPIVSCASDISSALKDVDGVEPCFMSTADKEAALVALAAARSQLEALALRVLASADDVAERHGTRDAAVWLAHATRMTRPAASGELRLARALEHHHTVTAALARGDVRREQAAMVVEAVDALPARVDDAVRDDAREALLGLADRHDARELRRIGKRILDIVAPEVGESHEAQVLAEEEALAAATASLTVVDDGHGRCHGRFTAPSHIGTMLRRHLQALANPARHDVSELTTEDGDWKPSSQRLGEAFVEYVERYPVDRTPESGGVSATVVVTMTMAQLLGDGGAAVLDDGSRMTAAQARRLACEGGIIPAVLGTASVPLDVGRRSRLFTKYQRIALGLRDGGCTVQGCDVSASGCHAHHDRVPWSRGGRSDLANGRLLCPRHHRHAHDARYDVRSHGDNSVTFHRRV